MRTERSLLVDIRAFWITGTGRGRIHDSETIVDDHGLPYLPGRHLRGLIRDAVEFRAELGEAQVDVEKAARLFGGRGSPEGDNAPGLIEVRDATLPKAIAQAARNDQALRDALFSVVHATAIQPETGTAADHTLRSFRVAVPMRLRGQIAWRSDAPADHPLAGEWDGIVERALPQVLGDGAHRHRGLGEAVLSFAP